jgi:hypothetical protein
MDQNQGQRRGHFHRGRRGSDRRGVDRRTPPQPPQERSGGQVDVEQIMREIRGRIAQRQGIDLSNQQIQDLAARRLESILDPRAIKPSLLDALRRSAGAQGQRAAEKIPNEPAFSFEDTTIYDSHRGLMRFIRRLLNPLLKLFFNPNPLIRALHIQAKLNVEAAERDAERDRRQTEWNALHYEIVQRLVTEVSRASLELQALSLRIESLDAKVEFNERRVRGIEGSVHRSRPQGERPPQGERGRPVEQPPSAAAPAESEPAPAESAAPAAPATEGQPSSEGARRRRRRRRGRRSGMGPGEPSVGGTPRPVSAALGAEADRESGPPNQHWPVGSQSDAILANAAVAPPGPTTEPGPQASEPMLQAPAAIEQVPDTGIYEAPPAPPPVPFEPLPPAPFELPPPVTFEHAPAPAPVEQAAIATPIEEAPPPIPLTPPPPSEEHVTAEPGGEPPSDDRDKY